MRKYVPFGLGAFSFILPLALYVWTLAPTYIPIDGPEFTLCVFSLGICHPPGFPLYVLCGKVFMEIFKVGSIAYRANLLSAFFAALTILFAYLGLLKLKVSSTISFFSAATFAVSATFWEYAIVADVFSFGTFLVALCFFLIFAKRRFLAFFVLGLSASHFYITAVLFPLVWWYLYLSEKEGESQGERVNNVKRYGGFAVCLLVFGLGFFPQVWLYFRVLQNPLINWGHAQGISGFFDFVRRREFGSFFLITNPLLQFSFLNLIRQVRFFAADLVSNFAVILPLFAVLSLGRIGKVREVVLLSLSFAVLVLVQLTLISTIDPTGANNPFQINKFYLLGFLLAVYLAGLGSEFLISKIFGGDSAFLSIFFALLVLVLFVSNVKTRNFSQDYFSENMVTDAFSQLPAESLAITVSHQLYFGGRYEQLANGKFGEITLLYFPNEKNRDNEYYYPEVFARLGDRSFVDRVQGGRQLGSAEKYILEIISRNLDKPVFIAQGSFEEGFFRYLSPYISPYGLWWKVNRNPNDNSEIDRSVRLLLEVKNKDIKKADLFLKVQGLDTLVYAVSDHSTAIALARLGRYDEALNFLDHALEIDPAVLNVREEIDLIKNTKLLFSERDQYVAKGDKVKLTQLGNSLFTLGNFEEALSVYMSIYDFAPEDPHNLNNIASSLASQGKKEEARIFYKRALDKDPKLDVARKGLDALGN